MIFRAQLFSSVFFNFAYLESNFAERELHMPSRYWFVPRPGYDGPEIVLTHGRWTKSGRFLPKHVSLTGGPSRLSRTRRQRIRMVGDPSTDVREIYEMHMAQKRAAGSGR